ncbi:hypothetical protein ALP72_101542 [Pseudomonas coronafaciens pv. coronafaciens]|nr:hypothetical protein ALQ81_101702 [Pseudomonas syringae pv. pisi]RMM78116.1 hypothetical protein ALQ71_101468 [Pseudomonas coronafaciens pv. striafaciens]RMR25959.1 hypothetical protein ALP89_101920 [Pseudomonas syringae pv. persicae]RMR72279.1 hypothetical protein ALP80_102203 [Pseudomonas savastanoi pv. fraxini]RMS15275.1 hypothetical protein ALP72_101542 [Pseudomonas coronafaciens pv. coronafaciens]
MSLRNFVTYVIRMPDNTASRTALTAKLNDAHKLNPFSGEMNNDK